MDMLEWAKNEVAIASEIERELEEITECECSYGCLCYDSAMRAFESLLGDDHSGMSIAITKNILERLIDGKPLTPIEDIEEVWGLPHIDSSDGSKRYQCKRMHSLFKEVARDGSVTYSDIDRYYCINKDSPDVSWRNGFIGKIYNEMYPITLPYMPNSRPDVIVCDEFLADRKNGYYARPYDILAILYIKKSNGERVEVNRYFEESEISFTEISPEEYKERQKLREERIKNEAEK